MVWLKRASFTPFVIYCYIGRLYSPLPINFLKSGPFKALRQRIWFVRLDI